MAKWQDAPLVGEVQPAGAAPAWASAPLVEPTRGGPGWRTVEQDPPMEVSLGDSLMQTAGEWGDVIGGLPEILGASGAASIAQPRAALAAHEALQFQKPAPIGGELLASLFGKSPEEYAAGRAGASTEALERMRDELAISQVASKDMEATGDTMAQRGLQQAVGSLIPSATAGAVTLATRNPVIGASAMYPMGQAADFASTLGALDERAAQQELETLQPRTVEDELADVKRAMESGHRGGVIEVGTELPVFSALLKAGTPAVQKVAEVLVADLPGETVAQLTQEINQQLALQPNGEAPLDAVFAGLIKGGKQLPETWLATMFGSAAQAAPFALGDALTGRSKAPPAAPSMDQMLGTVPPAPAPTAAPAALPAPVLEVTPEGAAAPPGEAVRAQQDAATQMGLTPDIVSNLQRLDADRAAQQQQEQQQRRALAPPDTRLFVDEQGNTQTLGQVEEYLRALEAALSAAQDQQRDLGLTPDVQANIDRLEARKQQQPPAPQLPAPDDTMYVDEAGRAGTPTQQDAYRREGNEQARQAAEQARAMGFTSDVAAAGAQRAKPVGITDETAGPPAAATPPDDRGPPPPPPAPPGAPTAPQSQNVTPAQQMGVEPELEAPDQATQLQDPNVRAALEGMKQQTGQAGRGGRVLRAGTQDPYGPVGQGQGEVTGKTPWEPRADWWTDRPHGMSEEQVHTVIDKALAGKPLKGRQQEMLDYLLGVVGQTVDRRRNPGGRRQGDDRRAPPPRATPDRRQGERRVDVMSRDEMRELLLTSEKTGLPNERAYNEREQHLPFTAAVDADGLGWLNKELGQEGGDLLIAEIGKAIRQHTDQGFHFHGDEFFVEGATQEELEDILADVQETLSKITITVTASDGETKTLEGGLGITFGIGRDRLEADEQLRAEKETRESQGLRAPKGAQPPGAHIVSVRGGQVEAEGGEDQLQQPERPDDDAEFGADTDTVREPPVRLRTGEEGMEEHGLDPGERYTTREVATALEKRQRALHGKVEPKDFSRKTMRRIARWMAAEVEYELQHPKKSGAGWYSRKFRRALRTLGEIFPELNTDKTKRDLLTALIAITSDGVPIQRNLELAVELYEGYQKTGKLKTPAGLRLVGRQIETLQRLLESRGPAKAHKFLMRELTVSEARRRAADAGVSFNVDMEADRRVPMAALLFGPKLGAFYANLMGADGYLTMDRWWSRTFNRYRGTLIARPTQAGLERFRQLIGKPNLGRNATIEATIRPRNDYAAKGWKNGTEIEKAANTIYKAAFENTEDTPRNAGDRSFMIDTAQQAQRELAARGHNVSLADLQAILWYYEKRLYGELGAKQSKVTSYEDAARKLVDDRSGKPQQEGAASDRRGRPGVGRTAEGTAAGEAAEDVPGGVEGEVRERGRKPPSGQQDLFTQADARPKSNEKQIQLANQILTERRADVGTGVRTLESTINKSFRENHSVSFLGQIIRTAKDLGALAQVVRDPRFETLRYIFTDEDGKIVAETAVSARLPASSNAFPVDEVSRGKDDLSKPSTTRWLQNLWRRSGAKRIWLLHNHPSGDSTPSDSDRALTQLFANYLQEPVEHVVVDHDEYSTISAVPGFRSEITRAREPLKTKKTPDPNKAPTAHRMMGTAIYASQTAAEVAKSFEKKGWLTIIGASARHHTKAIGDMPLSALENEETMAAALKRFAIENGAAAIFVGSVPRGLKEQYQRVLRRLQADGYVVDAVDTDGFSLLVGSGYYGGHGGKEFGVRAEDVTRKVYERYAPGTKRDEEQRDLLGDDTRQKQALANKEREQDKKRSPNRDVDADTGAPGDLFTKRRQIDIDDEVTEAREVDDDERVYGIELVDKRTKDGVTSIERNMLGEGPWKTREEAQRFLRSEVGAPGARVVATTKRHYEERMRSEYGEDIELEGDAVTRRPLGGEDVTIESEADAEAIDETEQAIKDYEEMREEARRRGVPIGTLDKLTKQIEMLRARRQGAERSEEDVDRMLDDDEGANERRGVFEKAAKTIGGAASALELGARMGALRRARMTAETDEEREAIDELMAELREEIAALDDDTVREEGKAPYVARNPQTETEEFKRWFGESKVVNDDGTPMRVYHATQVPENFNAFRIPGHDIGIHFGTAGQANDRIHYATKELKNNKQTPYRPRMIPVYLRIENPLEIDDLGDWTVYRILDWLMDGENVPHELGVEIERLQEKQSKTPEAVLPETMTQMRAFLQKRGYDGIKYINQFEFGETLTLQEERSKINAEIERLLDIANEVGLSAEEQDQLDDARREYVRISQALTDLRETTNVYSYAVFSPEQIKSAVGNTGEFGINEGDYAREAKGQYSAHDRRTGGQRRRPSRKGGRRRGDPPRARPGFYARMAQRALDAWNSKAGYAWGPLGKLPGQERYKRERYEALGKVAKSQKIARAAYDAFKNATPEEAKQVYDYLTRKGASPSSITNEKLRHDAMQAKNLIDSVGQRLVDEGLLSQEAYDEHKGEYLPRVYLKHLLGERAVKAIGSGKGTSDLGYLKKRMSEEQLPAEVRELILGEITDPAFLTSFSLGRTLRDLALLDFFKAIAGDKEWVPDNATVEWQGRNVSPFWLEAEARQIRRRAQFYQPEAAKKARALADQMEQQANAAQEALGAQNLDAYTQMPDTPRYGVLRGLWIRTEIYNDLIGQRGVPAGEGMAERILGDGGILSGLSRAFKFSKVVLNPPTQVRNFISNLMLLQLSGVPARLLPKRIGQALRSMARKDQYWQTFEKYGGTAATWQATEVQKLSDEWIRLRELGNPLQQALAWGAKAANAFSDAYGFMESVGKLAKIIDAIEREGKSPVDAMLAAHEALFDYSLVHPNVRYLRNNPLGAPFITFQYKVLPRLAELAIKHPQRFAPYALIPALLMQLLLSEYDVDDDDVEKLRQAFPAWMRERGQMLLLPWRDDHGRWQSIDFGYLVPWGLYADLYATAKENPSKAAKNALQQVALGGPLVDVAAAIETNTDPFTGREIVNPADPPASKLQAMLNYVWNLAMPGFLTESGAVNQTRLALEGRSVNTRGELRNTTTQALMRMFGINVYPVDPEKTRAANLRSMEYEASEIERRGAELLRDRGLTDEERSAIRDTFRELYRQQGERIQQYMQDSEIPEKLKSSQAGE